MDRSGLIGRIQRILVGPTGLVGLAFALAALSLLFPSTPSYDPWSWLIWGREITHWTLNTDPGPSWKPLTVVVTVPLSLFGSVAPDLWLVVARAGGILALVFGFRLAARMFGQSRGEGAGSWSIASVIGGLFAAVVIAGQVGFIKAIALGNSEGWLIAFVFWAIESHLEGRYRRALVLGALAALLRPETWPFLGLYGVWLLWRDRSSWKLILGLGLIVPLLWFVPEYIGSGNFLRAADRAHDMNRILPGSLSRAPDPFSAVIRLAFVSLGRIGELGVAVGAIAAVWSATRRQWTPLVLFMAGCAWIVLVAAMTAGGYAGNPRYLLLGASLLATVGGFGVAIAIAEAQALVARVSPRLATAGVAVLCLLAVAAVAVSARRVKVDRLTLVTQLRAEAKARDQLPRAVEAAGGVRFIVGCGEITTHPLQVPELAWTIDVPIGRVGLEPGDRGTAFQTRLGSGGPSPATGPKGGRLVAVVGPWTVLQRCPGGAGGA